MTTALKSALVAALLTLVSGGAYAAEMSGGGQSGGQLKMQKKPTQMDQHPGQGPQGGQNKMQKSEGKTADQAGPQTGPQGGGAKAMQKSGGKMTDQAGPQTGPQGGGQRKMQKAGGVMDQGQSGGGVPPRGK